VTGTLEDPWVGWADGPTPRDRHRLGSDAWCEVADWLVQEARLLDQNRIVEWGELLAPELAYRIPVRRNVRRAHGSGFDPRMMHFDDNHATMQLRIRRFLESDVAYSEDPPSRCRRVVADITVFDTDDPDVLAAESNLVLLRSRANVPETDVVSALRLDALRRADDGFVLAKRTVLLDQATIPTLNLSIFL
jgi:3-phenylpropionate/cinnamic acid dioxygenase small subunit